MLFYLTIRKLDNRESIRVRGVDGLGLAVSVNDDAIRKSFFYVTVSKKYLTVVNKRKARCNDLVQKKRKRQDAPPWSHRS